MSYPPNRAFPRCGAEELSGLFEEVDAQGSALVFEIIVPGDFGERLLHVGRLASGRRLGRLGLPPKTWVQKHARDNQSNKPFHGHLLRPFLLYEEGRNRPDKGCLLPAFPSTYLMIFSNDV